MKIDPRIAAIAAAVLAIGGIAVAKSRGSDHILPSPSSATGGPGAAAVEGDRSAENKPRAYPDASRSPSASPSPNDNEDEGEETSDTIGSDFSSDGSDSDSADASDASSDSDSED